MRVRYVLGAVLLAGATYFALFGGEYSLLDVYRIRQEQAREGERLEAVQADVRDLSAYADSLENDPALIERIARERWGLIRPGERLYRFDESPQDSTAQEEETEDTASAAHLRR